MIYLLLILLLFGYIILVFISSFKLSIFISVLLFKVIILFYKMLFGKCFIGLLVWLIYIGGFLILLTYTLTIFPVSRMSYSFWTNKVFFLVFGSLFGGLLVLNRGDMVRINFLMGDIRNWFSKILVFVWIVLGVVIYNEILVSKLT